MTIRRRLALPALLLAVPFVFFHEVCLRGQTFLLRDLHNWFYPWRDLARRWITSGDLPLWNPWSYLGTPFLANMQSGLLYPLNAPFWLMDFPAALRVFLVLQFAMTSILMARLLRELGCRPAACLTGAIGYAYGGWMVAHVEFPNKLAAAGWLPLIALGLVTWWRGRPRRGLALGSLGLALSIAAGYPQTTVTVLLGAAVLWVCRLVRNLVAERGRPAAWDAASLPLIVLLGALIAGALLVPFAEAASLSERSAPQEAAHVLQRSLQPGHFLGLAYPHLFGLPGYARYWGGELLQFWLGHFYVGLPVVLLAAAAPVVLLRRPAGSPAGPRDGAAPEGAAPRHVSRRWAAWAGLVLALVAALACLGEATPVGPLLVAGVPGMGHFRWFSTTSLLLAFSLCWLAALALDEIASRVARDSLAMRRAAFAAVALAAAAAVPLAVAIVSPAGFLAFVRALASTVMRPDQAPALAEHIGLVRGDAIRAAVLMAGLAGAWVAAARGRLPAGRAVAAVPVVLLLDLMGGASGINFTGDAAIYREEPSTLARLRAALPDGARVYLTQDTLEKDVRMYGADQEGYFRWASEIFLFNLNLPHGLFSASGGDPLRPLRAARWQRDVEATADRDRRRRLLAAAGVSHILLGSPGEPTEMIEVPGVMPRARVVPGLRRLSAGEAYEAIASGAHDPSREALVEPDFPGAAPPPGPPVAHTIHAVRHTPDAVRVDVESSAAGYLVLGDMMYPGWTAQVDGRPATVFTADFFGRGTELPAGRHSVIFRYRPGSVALGTAATAAGLLILGVVILRRER